MNKLKVALYSGEIPSTTFIERLVEGLAENGVQVLLFGTQHQKKRYKNLNIHNLGNQEGWRRFFFFLKYFFLLTFFKNKAKQQLDAYLKLHDLWQFQKRLKYYPVLYHSPDVFHLQWAKGVKEWAWVKDFGIKLVVSLRGTHVSVTPLVELKICQEYNAYFPLVDAFHAVSKVMAEKAILYGANPDKIKVVYSGLPTISSESKVDDVKKSFTIISVGRNHWIKGYAYAIDACRILKSRGFEFKYTIIGAKGSEELDYLISSQGLTDCVSLLSAKSSVEVKDLIEKADLLVLPSVEEGIANVVLEAMQLGTLVLSTQAGGMQEVISNGNNGFLVPIRDAESWAKTILKIANLDKEVKIKITAKAKQTILEQHSYSKMINGMMELYSKVLD